MLPELLLPDSAGLRVDAVDFDGAGDVLTIAVSSMQSQPRCPLCNHVSERVHSHYQRLIDDLPWAGRRVRLALTVRKFFCDNDACHRIIFTERLPDVVAPWARRTLRLAEEQRCIGQDVGGEAGARLSARQGMPVSPDTVLRLVRRHPTAVRSTPRVLGVDDWALRKGQTYGTILVDLEAHRVMDLLPDRASETLAQWLQDHPGVEVISRDRAGAYANGCSRGAPEAIQVADRFHLLQNLRETLERLLDRHQVGLQGITEQEPRTAAVSSAPERQHPTLHVAQPATTYSVAPTNPSESEPPVGQQAPGGHRTRREARYEHVMTLHRQGMGLRTIASHLHMSRRTVRRYIRADQFPEMAQRRKVRSILDPYQTYLRQQMTAGRANGMQLWREIRDQGYRGSRSLVSRWVAQHRQLCPASTSAADSTRHRGRPPVPPRPKGTPRPLSARRGSWLLVTQPERLTEEERRTVERLCQASSDVACGYELGQGFARMVREREADGLDAWLAKAKHSGLPDWESFAAGIEQDHAAVAAALSLPWSNGQTEGQVNRLKLIKRQMYGRANFDLLRQRVLAA